jgi:small-conductance mechanosensitive channel
MNVRIFALFAAYLLFFCAAQAQVPLTTTPSSESSSAVELPEELTPENVRDLVSRLSDVEVRTLLLRRLDAVAEADATPETAAGALAELAQNATVGVATSVLDAMSRVPTVGENISRSFSILWERLGANGLMFMLAAMTIAISGGLIIEYLFRRLVRGWVQSSDAPGADTSLGQTLAFLLKRLTSDVVAVFVFFVAANVIGYAFGSTFGPIFLDSPQKAATIAAYIGPIWMYLIAMPRLGAALARFLVAPTRPEYRIVHTDDDTARFLFRHQIGLIFLLGLTFWSFRFFAISGVPLGESRLGFWLNLAVHVYLAWMVWKARDGLRLMMRGPDPNVTRGEAWVAHMYPGFVIAATVLTWWLVEILASYKMWDLLANMPHILMIFLITYAPLIDTIVRGSVRHLLPPMQGTGPVAERAYGATRRSFIRIGRVIAFGIVVLLIGRIWGIDFQNLAAAGVGARFAGRMIEMLLILAVGYLIYEVVSLWINRKLAAEQTVGDVDPHQESGGEGGGAGGSRLSTVLPLVLAVARVSIVVVFVLLALGNVGVDTTPLLAGAGIVGLAIGFGAQKLVTDVVSGIFFLVDDAFRTGEYVEVDGTMGTVEKISIRSMQLRHHRGPVHTIPYGEIPKLTNYSRDWVIMKLRFTVPFDTDPNKVKKIFKKIGAEMLEDPLFKDDFLEPFKSQGVFEFDDVGIVIRGKFMARPGTQFTIRKEVYNRVKAELNAAGIDFARREVRVAIPGLDNRDDIDPATQAAIGAAASQVAQSPAQEAGTPKDDR